MSERLPNATRTGLQPPPRVRFPGPLNFSSFSVLSAALLFMETSHFLVLYFGTFKKHFFYLLSSAISPKFQLLFLVSATFFSFNSAHILHLFLNEGTLLWQFIFTAV